MKLFIIFSLFFINVYGNLSVIPLPRRNSRIHETCGKNEIFMECGKNCQTECPTLGQMCLLRQFKCPSGCYCIEGYAREVKHGRCIPISKCPNNLNSLYSGYGYSRNSYSQQNYPYQQNNLPANNSQHKFTWPYKQISLGEYSEDSHEKK